MANSYFQFKQFRVEQALCAMKVGTDGVLLGAWTDVDAAFSCLDIGTGTGLLALMVAQRNQQANIVALELDDMAAKQAKENVNASPWSNRIEVVQTDVRDYLPDRPFDLIVCNPPYFNFSLESPNNRRTMARHTFSLSYRELLSCVVKFLSFNGCFSLILPFDVHQQFIELASSFGLFCSKVCHVIPRPGASPKRALMEFSFSNQIMQVSELLIELKERHSYSEQYKWLTQDFYLDKG